MPNKGQKINKLDRFDSYKLAKIMDPVCAKDKDGFAVYAEGWDDARCALELQAAVGHPISLYAVAEFRRAIFGNFRRVPPVKPSVSKDDIIAELQAQIAELRAENAKLKGSLKEKEEAIEAMAKKLADVLLRLEAVERLVMPPQRKLDLPPAAE